MPASADLLKVLAEDPKSLEQQIGCMTGIFQIFDRHQAFIGRRYGSKRVSNASGQSQPTSACETPRHDRTNPYWMFEDDSSRRISMDSFDRPKGAVESTKEHHRAYSDNSEIFTKSFETPSESRTSPDQKSQLDQSSLYSEESVGGLAFYYNEPVREATTSAADPLDQPDLDQREYNKPNPVSPRAVSEGRFGNKDPLQSSSDIRDIVRASFHRERPRDISTKEKPRASVDGNQSHSYLKTLPRSSSVDGKDGSRMSVDGREAGLRQPADLPRSSSVDGRGGSRMVVEWKDGLRNTGGSPRMTIKEKDLLKSSESRVLPRLSVERNVTNHHDSTEGRDVTRLTVELKEGPRLSVSRDDRRACVDGKDSPRRLGPNSRYAETREVPVTAFDFRESLRAADFRDSLRASRREGPRFSVDGTRDAPRASIAPRLSVDGRDSAHSCAVPRRLKLDGRDLSRTSSRESNQSVLLHQRSEEFVDRDAEGEVRRRAPNVVARLMGLEELPSSDQTRISPSKFTETRLSREASLLQGFLQYYPHKSSPPPPPPCQSDDYNYMHQRDGGFSDHDVMQSRFRPSSARHRQRETGQDFQGREDSHAPQHQPEQESWCHAEDSNVYYSQSRSYLLPEHQHLVRTHLASEHQETQQALPQELAQPPLTVSKQSNEEKLPLSDGLGDSLHQKVRVKQSTQGRKTLWQILEAMHLKGLLHGSRRKQAEAAKLQNPKLAEEIQPKSQDLKPQQPTSLPKLTVTTSRREYIAPDYQDSPRASVPMDFIYVDPKAQEKRFDDNGHIKPVPSDENSPRFFDAEESPIVVMKPIITRSTSRSQASNWVPTQSTDVGNVSNKSSNSGMYASSTARSVPGEENHDRGAIKSVKHRVAVESPLRSQAQVTLESSHETSPSSTLEMDSLASLRQARKERIAARTGKSSSSVPQTGRDSSPRGPRSLSPSQEKLRPSLSRESSPLSPRCPGSMESVRVIDAGKVRRKTFGVKDREESKATLANLRANATKQEFLKGRASGDPDTPRLRRSSSDSKLLSKIAEKPIASDISGTRSPGGRAPSNITVLRSKRPIVKENKSPVKARPVNALGMKTVAKSPSAKEAVIPETTKTSHLSPPGPTSICATVPRPKASVQENLVVVQEPKCHGSKDAQVPSRCSSSEVRITQGGAVDQSGYTTNSIARACVDEPRPQSEEARIELDEGVKTPRGVSVKKVDFSDVEPAGVVEQPSPVSVLDNSHFEEELTPSPRAGKASITGLQDAIVLLENERRWSSTRFLDLDLEDGSPATLTKVTDAIGASADCEKLLDKVAAEWQVPFDNDARTKDRRLRVCLRNADEERAYVKDLVVASELTDESRSPHGLWSATGYIIDPSLFDQFEIKRRRLELSSKHKNGNILAEKRQRSEEDGERDALDRRVLFDCVNEVMDRILETHMDPMPLTGLFRANLRKRPMGQQLVQEVWDELQHIPCTAAEDVCDTVYTILQKDLLRGRGQHWSNFDRELGQICTEIEKMIVKDLIEETVRDLCVLGGHKPSPPFEATRRQLFVY